MEGENAGLRSLRIGVEEKDSPENASSVMMKSRLYFIDFARGIVMIIMSWDHLAGFWGKYKGGKMLIGSGDFSKTFIWFMSRFVTHYCAPTFFFIAGTVLAISTYKRLSRGESQWEVSKRIIERGVFLILIQFFIVNGAWDKVGDLYSYLFGVIACFGACFVLMSGLRLLPPNILLALSLYTILNHQFLSLGWIPDNIWWGHYLRVVIHEPTEIIWYPFTGRYPIVPWISVMALGWVFGQHIAESPEKIHTLKWKLLVTGLLANILWVIIRWNNGFGNLMLRMDDSLWEWLWLAKYPPSAGFLVLTLGGMCILLALGIHLGQMENNRIGILRPILDIGKTPLFFYIIHLWLYRFRLPGVLPYEFKLEFFPAVIAWLAGLPLLWYLCVKYEKIKRTHPESILKYI